MHEKDQMCDVCVAKIQTSCNEGKKYVATFFFFSFTQWTNCCSVRYKRFAKEQPICAHDYIGSGYKYWSIRANNLLILGHVILSFLSWHKDDWVHKFPFRGTANSYLRFNLGRLTRRFAKRMSRHACYNRRSAVFTCSVRQFQFFLEIVTFDLSITMGFKFKILSKKEGF